MIVYKLTEQQKNTIIRKEYTDGMFFNPIQDLNDNWVISKEEVDQSQVPWGWVKNLPEIQFVPKPSPELPNFTDNATTL